MDWDQGSRDVLICWFVSLASDLLGPSAVIWCDGKKKAETEADCSGHVHGEGWRSGGPQIDIGQGGLRDGMRGYVLGHDRSCVKLFCSCLGVRVARVVMDAQHVSLQSHARDTTERLASRVSSGRLRCVEQLSIAWCARPGCRQSRWAKRETRGR